VVHCLQTGYFRSIHCDTHYGSARKKQIKICCIISCGLYPFSHEIADMSMLACGFYNIPWFWYFKMRQGQKKVRWNCSEKSNLIGHSTTLWPLYGIWSVLREWWQISIPFFVYKSQLDLYEFKPSLHAVVDPSIRGIFFPLKDLYCYSYLNRTNWFAFYWRWLHRVGKSIMRQRAQL
jgi:hypothetical protein